MPDIPSVRGPFSFLDSIGTAASDVIGAKNKEELRRRDEQKQQADMLQQLISSGSVDPSQLQGPQVSGYYAASGGIDPTKLSSAPYKIKQEQATQAGQATQVGALTLQESMQHAEALKNMSPDQVNEFYKIPGSVDVATADDRQLAQMAKRYVYAAHGDANAGYAAAQLQSTGETRAKLNKSFFGQAAIEYANEQKELDAKLIAARRAGGRAGTPQEMLDNFMQVNVAQQRVLQEELAKMGNPVMDQSIPGQARRRRMINDEMGQYMAQQQILNAKMSQLMGVSTAPGMTPPPGGQAQPGNDPAVETAKAALAAGKATPNDVMTSTRLTPAQKQQILGGAGAAAPNPTGGMTPAVVDKNAEAKKKKAKSDKKFTDTLGFSNQ